jgi:hypothetical protein
VGRGQAASRTSVDSGFLGPSGNPPDLGAFKRPRRLMMASKPPTELPPFPGHPAQPETTPAQPDPAPTELPTPQPDIDIPDQTPGTSPDIAPGQPYDQAPFSPTA